MPPPNNVKTTWKGSKVLGDITATSEKAAAKAAELIFLDSQERVPLDTGALRQSGRVWRKGIHRRISYGNSRVPYAGIQHERTDFIHPVGEAKFLEKAIRAQKRRAKQIVVSSLRIKDL